MFTEQIRTYGKYGRGIHTAVTRVSLYKARAATVRAKGKLSVLKIGARAFKRLIGVLEFDKVY